MHDAVTVVIPGATNRIHVEKNVKASDLKDISSIIPDINSVYDEFIKSDVHNRW